MTISSRVVKADKAQDFQSWTTPLATLNEEFSPFFSLTAPAQAAPDPKAFAADEVHVLSQNQANSDNWQNFSAPGLDAPSADAGAGDMGGMSAEDLMVQQQMAMMAEAAGGDFNFNPNTETSTETADAGDDVFDDGFGDDTFDDGFGDEPEAAAAITPVTEEEAFTEARERGYAEGHAAGIEAGKAEGLQQGLVDGEAKGQEQAERMLTEELEKLAQAEHALEQVANVLGDALLQPMQRLALHMAKELVRGELTLSDAAVTRLVKGCMEQLDLTQDKVQVYLNNDDYQLLQADSMLEGKVSYLPSNDLQPGGVRVEQADSWVDDLLEERLIMLSRQALGRVDDKLLEPVNHLADEEQVVLHEESLPEEAIDQVQVAEPEPEPEQVLEGLGTEFVETVEPQAEVSLEELQAQNQTPEQSEESVESIESVESVESVESDEDWADLAAAGEDSAADDEELW